MVHDKLSHIDGVFHGRRMRLPLIHVDSMRVVIFVMVGCDVDPRLVHISERDSRSVFSFRLP